MAVGREVTDELSLTTAWRPSNNWLGKRIMQNAALSALRASQSADRDREGERRGDPEAPAALLGLSEAFATLTRNCCMVCHSVAWCAP